jgi:nucleotide-binding universal stress UspA family protein
MFSKMLVATDLSEASDRVICTLGGLKALGTREALLIHCFNIRDVGSLADTLMEQARPAFEKQKKVLEDQGFRVTAKMVLGLPHIEINRQADEHDCSLIVVGSHGETMAGEIMLGGVASAVIHSATRPVLILRLRLKDEDGRSVCEEPTCNPLGHVLFPTDFSDNAEHAFSYVQRIAECGAKRITLLHVQDQIKIDRHLKDRLEEFNRIDTERLERLKAELVKRGVQDVRIELPYGSPKKEIVARTKRDDVSLVVMGSQGRGYLAELFLGSVSHAVARHSEVPVLLIPAIR